jgi:glucokinase
VTVQSQPVRIGIDLGGTGTRFVALDGQRHVVDQRSDRTPRSGTANDAAVFLVAGIRGVAGVHAIGGIGIGASGPIDAQGVIQNPETLPGFTGVDIPAVVRAEFGLTPVIENDAVTAAVFESELGAGVGYRSLLMITLGTGVGVSMLDEGCPVRGADGTHPEAGHLSIGGPNAVCYCGRSVCWEQLASRTALERQIARRFDQKSSITLVRDCAARARRGDAEAMAAFAEYGTYIGRGLANLLTIYRPATVVFGGSASEFHDLYSGGMHEELARTPFLFPDAAIHASAAGAFGGAIGAALLRDTTFG